MWNGHKQASVPWTPGIERARIALQPCCIKINLRWVAVRCFPERCQSVRSRGLHRPS